VLCDATRGVAGAGEPEDWFALVVTDLRGPDFVDDEALAVDLVDFHDEVAQLAVAS
jgi:hypothetical protein